MEQYLAYEQVVCEACLYEIARSETRTVPEETRDFMIAAAEEYDRLPIRRLIRCPRCDGPSAKRVVSMPLAKAN